LSQKTAETEDEKTIINLVAKTINDNIEVSSPKINKKELKK